MNVLRTTLWAAVPILAAGLVMVEPNLVLSSAAALVAVYGAWKAADTL